MSEVAAIPRPKADRAVANRTLDGLPRLLRPAGDGAPTLASHLERYGPLPSFRRRPEALIEAVDASGLGGRGGAGFPTAVKLRAVAGRRRAIVVANGTEGEPASHKDEVLLASNPHLVLDGAVAAADAVGADEIVVAIGRAAVTSRDRLREAIAERERAGRSRRISLALVPDRFVAGEESALVHWLNGGPAKPTLRPPRPFEQGVRGAPTLVQNVETLAAVALIARFGPVWFRQLGTGAEPGSALVTVGGAVARPGVTEIELGTPLRDVLARFGGCSAPPQALLVGGYFGTWVAAAGALDAPVSNEHLHPLGAALGARTILVLPQGACGLAESARIARYLSDESAGQCGPCLFGLDAVAGALETLAQSGPGAAAALSRLPRLHAQVARRGACSHPDGAVRLVESALAVFATEVAAHLAGGCTAAYRRPVVPVPRRTTPEWS